MPRKSKKEKIIADLRRKLTTQPGVDSQNLPKEAILSANKVGHLSSQPVFTLPRMQPTSNPHPAPNTKSTYVDNDLRRITYLTILAIAFEAMLYWLGQRNIFPFLKF